RLFFFFFSENGFFIAMCIWSIGQNFFEVLQLFSQSRQQLGRCSTRWYLRPMHHQQFLVGRYSVPCRAYPVRLSPCTRLQMKCPGHEFAVQSAVASHALPCWRL